MMWLELLLDCGRNDGGIECGCSSCTEVDRRVGILAEHLGLF